MQLESVPGSKLSTSSAATLTFAVPFRLMIDPVPHLSMQLGQHDGELDTPLASPEPLNATKMAESIGHWSKAVGRWASR